MLIEPNLNDLITIFNQLFKQTENTELIAGADEPFYKAATVGQSAVIYTREDFFSSALHEIAHWCIAGEERRKQDDFGYWYFPEGRTEQQQQEFEQVEVKPQALEWLLSLACNQPFHFSADNLSQSMDASFSFKSSVTQQATHYLNKGLPVRAQKLFEQLNQHFRKGQPVSINEI